jgi:hypothetical protein
MTQSTNDYPLGWDEAKVKRVIAHYESQSDDDVIAEDEAAFLDNDYSVMLIPRALVPAVHELLHASESTVSGGQ